MLASLQNQFSNYRTSSLCFDIEQKLLSKLSIVSIPFDILPLKGHVNEADFLGFLHKFDYVFSEKK